MSDISRGAGHDVCRVAPDKSRHHGHGLAPGALEGLLDDVLRLDEVGGVRGLLRCGGEVSR